MTFATVTQSFLDRSATIVERALTISDSKWAYDVTVDYAAVAAGDWAPDAPTQDLLSQLVRRYR